MSVRWASLSSVVLRIGLGVGFSFGRGRQVRSVGSVWATECRVGEFLTVLGIHPHPQLVLAGGNDPAAGDRRHWR